MTRAVVILMLAVACAPVDQPPPRPKPPFAACLPRPAPLPVIATVEQLRERHDKLDKLYLDCAARLRRNIEAMKE